MANTRGLGFVSDNVDPWKAQKLIMSAAGISAPNIFDLGASIGNVSAKYRETFPGSKIYAFEPLAEQVAGMKKRFAADKNIHVLQAAISDKVGRAKFYKGGSEGNMSSMYPRPSYGVEYYENNLEPIGDIDTDTIDNFVERNGIVRPHIIKADIHGSEMAMIKGAHHLLYRQFIEILYLELLCVPLYDAPQSTWLDVCTALRDYGYTMYHFYGGIAGKNGQHQTVDVMFISRHIRVDVVEKPND